MKRIAAVCVCLLAGALSPPRAASGRPTGGWQPNFAENPSAEEDANRDGLPDGWTPGAFRSPAKLAWDRGESHSGEASLRVADSSHPTGDAWDENTGRWVARRRRKVTPGASYTLRAWIKTREVTGRATACIAWWNGGSWLAESYTKPLTGTAEWTNVGVTAVAPPRATDGQIYLNLSRSKGTAWFDDISMAKGARLPSNFRPVDISSACNTGLTDETAGDGEGGWTDQGKNDMRNLPIPKPGEEVRFRGVPFRIIAPGENRGRSCIVLKGRGREGFPDSAGVSVGRKCETIYFLHVCAWGGKGARVGHYELEYDDGSTTRIPLVVGREITDWWQPHDTTDCAVAWEGANPASPSVGLNIFPVANPRPDLGVRGIRFVAAVQGEGRGDAVPILVAITTADGPPVLTDLPIRYEFTDTAGWYPFTFPLDDTNLDGIDLTGLLDPPAGRHGFLGVRDDGHFYFEDGTRARFFGTNVGGRSAFPEEEQARTLAARLAKYGVNMLRIHAIDSRWAPLIDYERGDSRHLRADMLDRLDFFLAELKKRGIYVYFDGLDYRRFLPADGVTDAEELQHGWTGSIKGASCFNDRMIELQKEFATEFFTHRNPYTGLRYCDDPAVAVVEITNENSVFYFRNTTLTLPVYIDELRRRWNDWLVERHGGLGRDPTRELARAWTNAGGECALLPGEDPARGTVFLPMKHLYQDPTSTPGGAPHVGRRSPARVNAMVRFFFDLERRYYREMRKHLKEIGVRVPITGTNQAFCPASVCADSVNEFMSRNNYWCHPNVRAKPFFTFRNLSVLRSDLAGTSNPVTNVASSTVVGKPMISPEFNWPWPIEYRAECLPLMAAYACLQDWDGLLFFAYSPERKHLEWFGSQSDPVRWGTFPAAALLFHRQDVSVAKSTVHVGYSLGGPGGTAAETFTAGRSHIEAPRSPFRHFTYVSKVRNAFLKGAYQGEAKLVRGATYVPPVQKRYVSDTGELVLDTDRGLFTIDTPRTKAAVGFLGGQGRIDLGGLSIECKTPFAAVIVTSLDGKPIARSRRLLVTAVARAENTGQAFYRNRSSVPERGRLPVIVEPVEAAVSIATPGAALVYTLDETGERRGRLPATFGQGTLRLELEDARSPWCEILTR